MSEPKQSQMMPLNYNYYYNNNYYDYSPRRIIIIITTIITTLTYHTRLLLPCMCDDKLRRYVTQRVVTSRGNDGVLSLGKHKILQLSVQRNQLYLYLYIYIYTFIRINIFIIPTRTLYLNSIAIPTKHACAWLQFSIQFPVTFSCSLLLHLIFFLYWTNVSP